MDLLSTVSKHELYASCFEVREVSAKTNNTAIRLPILIILLTYPIDDDSIFFFFSEFSQ